MSGINKWVHGLAAGTFALALTGTGSAEVTFDFEGASPLASSLISGDKGNFAADTAQAHSGTQSIRFADTAPEPFESWTYHLPFSMTSGTVTVWFHDVRGAAAFTPNPAAAKWGASVILEDAANTGDFGAVEICELPYGGGSGRYYASEGSTDRAVADDRFDSNSLPFRSTGSHKIEFQVGATETIIKIDGLEADEVRAPGGDGKSLRLRFMADSASDGGFGNWTTSAATQSHGTLSPWVYYDDLGFDAELPAVATHSMGFELISGTAEYDTAGEFMGPSAHDNPHMAGFVNQWDVVTSAAVSHSGDQAAFFSNPPAPFKSLVFDLSTASPGTTATVWLYDALGANTDFDKFGGSVLVESGTNSAEFLAVEVWNAEYPLSGDPTPGVPNYYLTQGIPGSPNSGMLHSRELGNRSVGWHKVEIGLYATHSIISVDGVTDSSGNGVVTGPGLNKSPRLRLMADSATSGGFANWVGVDELLATYLQTTEPYIYYDDVTLPVSGFSAVTDWNLYE